MNAITAKRTFDGNDPDWPEKLKAALTEDFAGMEAGHRKAAGKPPMKNTPEDQAVSDQAYGIAAGELRQFIEQYEQLEAEKKDAADRQKELMAEAKARGYSTPTIRKVVALRKKDADTRAEEEAVLGMYLAALGMN